MPSQIQNDQNLLMAARTGDVLIARVSIRDGANVNFVDSKHRDLPHLQPSSPLLLAVGYVRIEIVEMLLAAGCRLPDDERGRNRLSSAARYANCPDALLLLFRSGLSPTREDADWAEEHGHSAVKKYALNQLGEYSFSYDIDELLNLDLYDFYSRYASNVPGPYSIHEGMLFPQERVLRDVWEFEICTGSGFLAMLDNQMFDVVARSHSALHSIGASHALSAISELKLLLQKQGIRDRVGNDEEVYETLSDEGGDQVADIDKKYFGGQEETNIWINRDHLNLGVDYARMHIQILRNRKQRGID